jgi:hypothetical protein
VEVIGQTSNSHAAVGAFRRGSMHPTRMHYGHG